MASTEKKQRIVHNTLMLYVRMLLIMTVTLYTSRIILNTLGVEDFGIYNVVSGVIVMLSFIYSSLGGTGARFIAFSLGKEDFEEVKQIFATLLCIHFILAGIIILIGETIGLWFVMNKLVIPETRKTAVLWVYHCSILTTVVSIISVPYNSLIIAHERMRAFAYISVIEVILKLAIVWLLLYIPYDKLIVYSVLYLVIQIIIRMIYNNYCFTHFQESKTSFIWNPRLIKTISAYAGWTMNGNLAVMGYTQGLNILLNMFFGPIVNAARAIAVQVQAAVMTFVQNFQMAINPQLVKSYAILDMQYMHTLIILLSKYGFFLMLVLAFPFFLLTHSILKIWLGTVPEHTANFIYIMLLIGLFSPLGGALTNAIHATGNIKKFQIYEGTSLLMVVPLAYVLLKLFHISPEGVMIVYLGIEIFTLGIRIWIVLPRIAMPYSVYFHKVILPIIIILPFCIFPVLLLSIPKVLSLGKLILYAILGVIYISIFIYTIGINSSERKMIHNFILIKINKRIIKE